MCYTNNDWLCLWPLDLAHSLSRRLPSPTYCAVNVSGNHLRILFLRSLLWWARVLRWPICNCTLFNWQVSFPCPLLAACSMTWEPFRLYGTCFWSSWCIYLSSSNLSSCFLLVNTWHLDNILIHVSSFLSTVNDKQCIILAINVCASLPPIFFTAPPVPLCQR